MHDRSPCFASRPKLAGLATIVAMVVVAGVVPRAFAQEDKVAEGQRIWSQKAECPQCHGWAGDGNGGLHSAGLAASLRGTKLSRDEIRMTIQCGRPGTPMPHFDRFAYTDKRCYDMTAKELGDATPDRAASTLQPYEIDALADYIAVKLKGSGPVTKGECIEFYRSSSTRCDSYPSK